MAITLYEITVPVMIKSMKIIQTLLIKGAEHVKAVGGDEDKLVDIKLVDDMGGLAFQSEFSFLPSPGELHIVAGFKARSQT